MKFTLINHACCKVESASMTMLMDTWVDGPAFNFGWDLLIPTPASFDEIMSGVTHIWISHEHPDHFSVPFLFKVGKSKYKDKVKILFQKTRDHRVVDFCAAQGLTCQELDDRVPTKLTDEITVICGVTDFYDSWLSISDGQHSILNLNDVHTRTDKDAAEIATHVPQPTLMLTQFSYASWKGGRENAHYRALAAQNKLETLTRQIRHLKPKFTLPFASFIYFSNKENSYLNDLVNTPAKASLVISESGSQPVVLYPNDTWQVGSRWDNAEPLKRYEKVYSEIDQLPYRDAGKSATKQELSEAFAEYQKRVFEKNNRSLIEFVSCITPLKAFQALHIELYDLGLHYNFSVVDGMVEIAASDYAGKEADLKLHSSSFLFILKNDFGFDTLLVNGRFEATQSGFSKMTKSLAIGSLNAMGLSLSFKLLADFRFVLKLLGMLANVLSKLRQSETSKAVPAKQTEKQIKEKSPANIR